MTATKGYIASRIPDKALVVASVLLFKFSWLLLVLQQDSALMPVLFLQLVGILFNPQFNRKYLGILLVAITGFLLEQGAVATGVIHILTTDSLLWLVLLWFAFVHALTHGLQFLARLPAWGQMLAGALLGPLAYIAASALGALEFGLSAPVALSVLAIGWALFLPLATRLLRAQLLLPLTTTRQACALLLVLLATQADAGLPRLGQGTLKFLFMPIYDAALFAESADSVYPPRGPFELQLVYRRAFSAEAIINETLKQWQARQVAVQPGWQDTLAALIPAVEPGDALTLAVDGNLHARLVHNGRTIGTIDDPDLLTAFAGIWLAPDTTRPELRTALLGAE
jgi:hypothetical protein